MVNNVIVTAIPVFLTGKQQSATWKLRKQIADMDLAVAVESIQRQLQSEIPVNFNFPVKLKLSISIHSYKIKIDYSAIKSRSSVRLIKLYLTNDRHAFAREWMRLV